MPPSDVNDLRAAWRALAGSRQGDGWRTIPVAIGAPCSLFAGIRMPGRRGGSSWSDSVVSSHFQTPGSRRDTVSKSSELRRLRPANIRLVVALARRPSGRLELFAMMAEDLVRLLGWVHRGHGRRPSSSAFSHVSMRGRSS